MKQEIKDIRPITERIKTFEDACRELGNSHPFVQAWKVCTGGLNGQPDIESYLKLRIICAALNERWQPKLTKDEYRYYPYFYLYTKEEINEMSEEERSELVLWGGVAGVGAYCSLACAHSNHAWSYSASFIGSRLCLKNSYLATYCGKQFIDIWADFCLIKK